MEAYKIMRFLVTIGWHIVKNEFAMFLGRPTGALEYNHPSVTSISEDS